MSDDLDALLAKLTPEERAQLAARLAASDAIAGDKVGGDKVARDKVVEPQGTVTVSDEARINGVAVGVNLGRIVYGRDPEEDERRRLVWYLEGLAAKLSYLPLRGLDERLSRGEGLALPQVYTELATASEVVVATGSVDQLHTYLDPDRLRGVPAAEIKNPHEFLRTNYHLDWALPSVALIGGRVDYSIRPHERREDLTITLSRRLLATEALIQHQHLVLLGDPGSGKSTFVRHLAWTLARREINPADAPALAGWDTQVQRLPIILPLRTLSARLAHDGVREVTVYAALCDEMHGYCVNQVDDALTEALTRGAALLLFDGLDEVPLEGGAGIADRRTTLQTVEAFTKLYARNSAVVTCRTRAFDDTLRGELGWPVETLAPFTLGQIRHFVPAWYDELVAKGQITAPQAENLSASLTHAILDPTRPRLREMATTPLLLTLMPLILYNKGELPRDRPQLYERILELLLGQWDAVRDGQSLGQVIGKPEWDSTYFRPPLDQLSYEAHRDAVSQDGRGRLDRGNVYIALRDFFKHAKVERPGDAADRCLDYVEQRSGLLAPDDTNGYVFAHLTIQEHCAGSYIALGSDNPVALIMQHRSADRWREPIFLGAGLMRPAELNALLADLIDREEASRPKALDRWYRDLILAAEIGADRDWDYLRTRPMVKVERLQRDLKRGLVELLGDKAQSLPVADRVRAGFLLGDLGDPRFPITLDDWRRELAKTQAGDASSYFCRVEPGTYTIGSAVADPDAGDEEQPQHTVTFGAPFLIARYPITNDQWQPWVEQGGGQPSYAAGDSG